MIESNRLSRPSKQLIVIASIVVLTLVTVFVTQRIIVHYLDSGADEIGREVNFDIARDESVDSISERLEDDGLIRSPGYFRFRVRLDGSGDKIVAGRYVLNTSMSTSQIIDAITSEDAALAQELTVQFIEGWRTEQFSETLADSDIAIPFDDFMAATEDPKWNQQFDFLHTRPSGVALEGYLFPDTYNVREGWTPDDVIERLLTTFGERVTPEMIAQADSLGMTLHQVITIASIVEREAAVPEERPIIASVYYNRLTDGMPLQADPTVQYQLGTGGEWWPTLSPEDLQQGGSYNTYLNPSLPPGPICNPSLASIEAALFPARTNYRFFVSKGDGSHAFADTFEEHEENIRLYHTDEEDGEP
jgi:UPF0755 protein